MLVDGSRTTTVARVAMNTLTVDLTHLPHTGLGSEATLWGSGPRGTMLSIHEVARRAQTTPGTIPVELMCRVPASIPRLTLA